MGIKSHPFWLILLLISLVGGGLLTYASRGGLVVEADVASYYSAAQNLVSGKGFGIFYPSGRFEFFSLWAPLFSFVLAGLSLMTADIFELVRWLNVCLFFAFIFMVGGFIFLLSKSIFLSILTSTLVAFSPLFIKVYVAALSEPLFLLFSLAGMFGTLVYINNQKSVFFYLSAFSIGLAVMTRYAGIPLALTTCIGLFLFLRSPLKERLWKTVKFGLVSMLGPAIWFWVVWRNTGTLGGRQIIMDENHRQSFNIIKGWLITRFSNWITDGAHIAWIEDPRYYKPFWIIMIILFIVLSGLLVYFLSHKLGAKYYEFPGFREMVLFLLFIIIYISFLVISYVYSVKNALVDRIFSPIELFTLLFLVALIIVIGHLIDNKKRVWLASIPLMLLCVMTVFKGVPEVLRYPAGGIGYNNLQSRSSLILQKIRDIPPDVKLISNEGSYLLFHLNKFPYPIMELYQTTPNWDFPIYGSDMNDPSQIVFRQEQAALIIFPSFSNELSVLYGDQITIRMEKMTEGLFQYYSGSDGEVYFYQKPDFLR